MEHARSLLTGLHGAALRDRVLAQPIAPETLWIAPSPLAAEQILGRLTLRRGVLKRPRVWTWRDLWREIGRDRLDQPALLSNAGRHAVLSTAIDQRTADGTVHHTAELVRTHGYRRALLRAFDRWTLKERHRSPNGTDLATEIEREEWEIYQVYRNLLAEVAAEDEAGYASWASEVLQSDPSPRWQQFGHVVVFEPRPSGRASWRAFGLLVERAQSIQVTHSGRASLSVARDALRDRFLVLGFRETECASSPERPSILTFMESNLFEVSRRQSPPIDASAGLSVLGAPRGDGLALVIAREVRKRIASGVSPESILILVPCWDDQAERIVETLRSWDIAASNSGGRPLTSDPATSALLRAARLPVDGWDASQLMGLLRHGRVASSWSELEPSQAALAIRESGIFRGRDVLRRALLRAGENTSEASTNRRAKAVEILDRLGELFQGVDEPAGRDDHLHRVSRIVDGLGLRGIGEDARPLELLMNHLEEVHEIHRRFGRDGDTISWDTFVDEVDSLVRVLSIPERRGPAASVRVTTVDAAAGARAEVVILANLGEGTFPSRDALQLHGSLSDPAGEREALRQAIGSEMSRFLRVLGSADRAVVLAYPTKDQSGVPLNMTGFVDELKDRLGPETWEACSEVLPRLMPVLSEDLAGSPHERRVRAMGLACANPGADTFPQLASLAAEPLHRGVLQGVAVALRVAHQRQARRHFGPFDGMLHDPAAVRRIAEDFGPNRPAFSASQLESFSFCPFQFFLRYICHLTPTPVRGEFDEDLALRGRVVHEALQNLHELLRDTPGDHGVSLAERVSESIKSFVLGVLESFEIAPTDEGFGTRLIESRILEKTALRYENQFRTYADKHPDALGSHFEVNFGPGDDASGPCLQLGKGPDLIRLQGQIDRIDTFGNEELKKFRIIDYKNGTPPGASDLKNGLALQLPLYAMAAETILFAGQGIEAHSAGYWSLKKDGYRPLVTMTAENKESTWPKQREALERFVIALVRQLRQARMPVRPRTNDCTKWCDYSTVCRIGSLRHVGKIWTDAPKLELEE